MTRQAVCLQQQIGLRGVQNVGSSKSSENKGQRGGGGRLEETQTGEQQLPQVKLAAS
jgi:hypothetical protein